MDQDQDQARIAPSTEASPRSAQPVLGVPPRPRGSTRLLNAALAVAVVAAIGGVAFAAGRMTAPERTTVGNLPVGGNFPGGGQGFPGNGGNRPGNIGGPGVFGSGGMAIEGTVESVSDTTLTLKTADGQTIQVALDGGTAYHSQTDASAADVTTGGRVRVQFDIAGGGPVASGSPGGLSASDVTIVP